MRLVDEDEGFVNDALGAVEFHQVALALQDGEVAAASQVPQAHVGIVAVFIVLRGPPSITIIFFIAVFVF